jgi:hypothetical protein
MLGAPKDKLCDQNVFRYCEPEDRGAVGRVVKDCKEWRPAIAVVDSIGELMPMLGASSNSADEFTNVHSGVLKPLAMAGAAVVAIDHLVKSPDSRAHGPGGTAAKRRAVGGASLRVKAKRQFVPGKGGSATLLVNKDRHGGLRVHCPLGDREQVAGTFVLDPPDEHGAVRWRVLAPLPDERNLGEAADPADVAAVAALDPPPTSVEDARARLHWNKSRATNAVREWRCKSG